MMDIGSFMPEPREPDPAAPLTVQEAALLLFDAAEDWRLMLPEVERIISRVQPAGQDAGGAAQTLEEAWGGAHVSRPLVATPPAVQPSGAVAAPDPVQPEPQELQEWPLDLHQVLPESQGPPVAADPQLREPCDHVCLKDADHEGPHFYGYIVGPYSPSRMRAALAAPERDGEPQPMANTRLAQAWKELAEARVRMNSAERIALGSLFSEAGELSREVFRLRHPPADTGGERVREIAREITDKYRGLGDDDYWNDEEVRIEALIARALAASGTPTEADDAHDS